MNTSTLEQDQNEFAAHEIANGNYFAQMHRDRVLFDHTFDEWRIWDGTRWGKDQRGQIWELAKATAYQIQEQAAAAGSKELIRQASSALNHAGLRNMLACARSLPQLAVTAEDWDRDPLLFNVRNGTIDLRTSTLREHCPTDKITLAAACDYEPEATASQFLGCLNRYWPEHNGLDAGVADFIIMCMGYCLSGLNSEKLFLLLHGTGDTGKTTLMKAIEATWGDYFKTADWSTFAQQRDGDTARHRTDLVRLVGARIVSASEGDEGCKMSEGIIKRITGRTALVVRDIMSKPFAFYPMFKLWLDTNHLPRFRGQDRAMWNRIRRVLFRIVITHEEQRTFRHKYGDLDQLLATEASGILNLALQGWNAYLDIGTIVVPESVQSATTMYQAMEDSLGQFLEDKCIVAEEASVEKSEVFAQYVEWAKEQGEYPASAKRFGIWMMERGFQEERTRSSRKWLGLTVKETRRDHSLRLALDSLPPPPFQA